MNNEFYLKYAYIVVYKLLQMTEFGDREYSDFSILDYYSDDIRILVYDKGNSSKIERFDISNYAVDLFSKGYSLDVDSRELLKELNNSFLVVLIVEGYKLWIQRIFGIFAVYMKSGELIKRQSSFLSVPKDLAELLQSWSQNFK